LCAALRAGPKGLSPVEPPPFFFSSSRLFSSTRLELWLGTGYVSSES
jgi:hypothetical protein